MALVALLISLQSGDALAFEISTSSAGAELRWSPASFNYGAEGDETFAAAVRAAADTWVIGSRLGVDARWAGSSANNTVLLTEWDDAFGDVERTVAHAEQRYEVSSGRMIEGDIFLNDEKFDFGEGGFDVQSVVLHEFGHVLGLDHSCGIAGRTYPSCFSVPEPDRDRILEAVMAPGLAPEVERRALGLDDLAGLSVHYRGTATGTVPSAVSISRRCPEGTIAIEPQGFEATLRFTNGEVKPFEDGFVGRADLVLREPSGLYSVAYLVESPMPCPPAPPPEEGGCGCTAHRQRGGIGAMLLFVIGMILLRRRWLAVALLVLFAEDALAFKCSRVGADFGPSLVWTSRTIPWYAEEALFDLYGDRIAAEEDVRFGFLAWEDVGCSDVTLPLAAIIPGLRAGYDNEADDNKNVVVALYDGWPYDRQALAITTSAYDTRTGIVVDADIEINAEHFDFRRVDETCDTETGVMDLRNTITHEVGHIIGLDHPPNTPRYEDVTMYASAPPCEFKKRTLEEDDIDGLCSIYPIGNPTMQCYPPDGPSFLKVASDDGFGCSASGDGSLWILVGLLLILRRGSRAS